MQGEDDIMKARCNRLAGSVTSCDPVAQSKLNESHPASNGHGSLINDSHSEKRCVLQDPAEPSIQDDCGTFGPPRIFSGNCSRRAILRNG
jgi:hypothetical protein